jgi:hypothetical protein
MPVLSRHPEMGRTGFPGCDTNGRKHEVVKVAVMKRRLSVSAGLLLLSALTLPGATSVEAAGIGVQLGGYGHTIPRAIAGGHNPHVDAGRARSKVNTRSIQPNTTGESAAIKSRK